MNFIEYAPYYDLLYKDKDYEDEANYVHNLIKKFHPASITILDLGCGTGKHAFALSQLNYHVTGIDKSMQMVSIAQQAAQNDTEFLWGDLRHIRLQKKFDVVISLFDVISYQVEDDDLVSAFETASFH